MNFPKIFSDVSYTIWIKIRTSSGFCFSRLICSLLTNKFHEFLFKKLHCFLNSVFTPGSRLKYTPYYKEKGSMTYENFIDYISLTSKIPVIRYGWLDGTIVHATIYTTYFFLKWLLSCLTIMMLCLTIIIMLKTNMKLIKLIECNCCFNYGNKILYWYDFFWQNSFSLKII